MYGLRYAEVVVLYVALSQKYYTHLHLKAHVRTSIPATAQDLQPPPHPPQPYSTFIPIDIPPARGSFQATSEGKAVRKSIISPGGYPSLAVLGGIYYPAPAAAGQPATLPPLYAGVLGGWPCTGACRFACISGATCVCVLLPFLLLVGWSEPCGCC